MIKTFTATELYADDAAKKVDRLAAEWVEENWNEYRRTIKSTSTTMTAVPYNRREGIIEYWYTFTLTIALDQ